MTKYVREIMKENLVILEPDDSVAAANSLMESRHIHSILIPPPEGGKLWRIFTETDVLRALKYEEKDPHNIHIADYASSITIVAYSEWTCEKALDEMVKHGVKHLPIVDDSGRVFAMISSTDIRRALAG